MDLLLDTNAFIWALNGELRFAVARPIVEDRLNRVFVSAASAWEIAIKAGLGKLKVPPEVASWLPAALNTAQFTALPINLTHA